MFFGAGAGLLWQALLYTNPIFVCMFFSCFLSCVSFAHISTSHRYSSAAPVPFPASATVLHQSTTGPGRGWQEGKRCVPPRPARPRKSKDQEFEGDLDCVCSLQTLTFHGLPLVIIPLHLQALSFHSMFLT